MKSHQTCERPELSIGMLPLCPDCRQRAENSRRWLQSPSWLWHTPNLAESKQTKAKLQLLYRLSESASAVELQFLYPAVGVSCFKTWCCICHGQQIKSTVVPVSAQLHGCTNTAPSWFVSTGTGVMQPVMMSTACCCTHGHACCQYCGQRRKRVERSFIKRILRMSAEENRDIYPNFYESEYFQRSGKYQTVISKNSIVSYAFKAFNNIIYTQNILNS